VAIFIKADDVLGKLKVLLTQFEPEYNVRRHQGLPISGLSPNEFVNRIG
jgi:hypothetical protein